MPFEDRGRLTDEYLDAACSPAPSPTWPPPYRRSALPSWASLLRDDKSTTRSTPERNAQNRETPRLFSLPKRDECKVQRARSLRHVGYRWRIAMKVGDRRRAVTTATPVASAMSCAPVLLSLQKKARTERHCRPSARSACRFLRGQDRTQHGNVELAMELFLGDLLQVMSRISV